MYFVLLTLTVLVTTIDAQWEGMGDVGSDHKGFKLQKLVNFQKISTLRVNFLFAMNMHLTLGWQNLKQLIGTLWCQLCLYTYHFNS